MVLDLNDTVDGMLRMLKRLIGEDIELIWRPDTDIWPVKMDPAQLDQNLIELGSIYFHGAAIFCRQPYQFDIDF
jgi:hypothetical protein